MHSFAFLYSNNSYYNEICVHVTQTTIELLSEWQFHSLVIPGRPLKIPFITGFATKLIKAFKICKYLPSTYLYLHIYLYTYLPTSVPTYLGMYDTYLPTYIHTYLPTYIPTYLPTYIPTYIPTYLYTYLPTYIPIPTYLHTNRLTYV